MNLVDSVEAKFKEIFNEQPLLIRSPGRVNLIGEHTDYNHGYVLPAAIDKAIYLAIAPRADQCCRISALDMGEEHEFGVSDLQPTKKAWSNYLMGVVDQLVKGGHKIDGFNYLLCHDHCVPRPQTQANVVGIIARTQTAFCLYFNFRTT